MSLIGVIIIALLALIVVEFVILQTAIVDSSELRRAVKETAIAEDINSLEFLKRVQKSAVNYSFYGAYYFLGKHGGYLDFSGIRSYDCIPYWQVYDEKKYPELTEIEDNIKKAAEKIFYNYLDSFRTDEISVPYYQLNIKNLPSSAPFPSEFEVEANANQNLKFESKYVKIEEKGNFSCKVNAGLLSEFISAKNFIESHDFKKIINDAISEVNLKSSCSLTKSSLPSDEDVFSDQNCNGKSSDDAKRLIENKIKEKLKNLNILEVITFSEIYPSCTYTKTDSEYTKTCSFSFDAGYNALVKISSYSAYPLENGIKNFEFNFRILVGTKIFSSLELFNSCQEKL